jgi:hypothetical protein
MPQGVGRTHRPFGGSAVTPTTAVIRFHVEDATRSARSASVRSPPDTLRAACDDSGFSVVAQHIYRAGVMIEIIRQAGKTMRSSRAPHSVALGWRLLHAQSSTS